MSDPTDDPGGDAPVPAARPERAVSRGPGVQPGTRGIFSKDEAAEAEEPGWLAKLSATLTDLAADISSVTVRTYVAEDVGAAVADRREIGEVGELRAWTRIAIDGDTDVCVPLREGKIDRTLWTLHNEVVAQAQAHRTEMIKALIASVSGLWAKKK